MPIRLRYIALALVLTALAFGGLFLKDLDAAWRLPGPLPAEKLVYIPPGSGTNAIAYLLKKENVIDNPLHFRILARFSRVRGDLKAGEYELSPGISISGIVHLLQSGKTHQRKITFAEGLTSLEIAELINAAEAMTGAVNAIPPEGTLLPETYSYSYGDDRAALAARMQAAMKSALEELWPARDPAVLVKTPEDAVTLASIVEKETGIAPERARVAGVFLNRLKTGMPLQSDPTVIYAVTEGKTKLDRPLSRKDLAKPSPYNTYTTPGLPPGPIANPGRSSLEAVLHPETHDYFYFVADGTGGHAFAATLTAHNKNVAQWRKIEQEK